MKTVRKQLLRCLVTIFRKEEIKYYGIPFPFPLTRKEQSKGNNLISNGYFISVNTIQAAAALKVQLYFSLNSGYTVEFFTKYNSFIQERQYFFLGI